MNYVINNRYSISIGFWLIFIFFASSASAAQRGPVELDNECVMNLVNSGPEETTISEIRRWCSRLGSETVSEGGAETENLTTSPVEERLAIDKSNVSKPFSLMAHKQNYILFAAHNFKAWDTDHFKDYYDEGEKTLDDTEIQFQLSVKVPLALDLFGEKLDLYGAYTVRSFWQAYNKDISSPFRETNHEPEIWAQLRSGLSFGRLKNTVNAVGIVHQSNGRSGSLSRSWNRVYAGFGFEWGDFAFFVRPWIRIPESSEDDDNPDITDFLGHGSLHVAYKSGDHLFTLMSRNNLESGFSKGAVQLGWSFPLPYFNYLKGYVQYFGGYGESLTDYDQYVNRIGVGLLLTDLL